jgi:AmmeMemoRadiSam system protein B
MKCLIRFANIRLQQFLLSVFLCAVLSILFLAGAMGNEKIRKSPIAGSWYPGEKKQLQNKIDEYLARAKPPAIEGHICALISPHAGIEYSGQAAACGYKLLKGQKIKRVIVLGPSHYSGFRGLSTSAEEYYETPLGKIKVDKDISEALCKIPLFQGPQNAELQEHSLEMQLPFLQVAIGEFLLVPLVVGELSLNDYAEAARALSPYLDTNTIVVASSDFTHYGYRFGYVPFKENIRGNLKNLDEEAVKKIIAKDLQGFLNYVDETGATICGTRPIGIMLKMLPAKARGTLLDYYTSGDLTGDFINSVSYASIAFTVQ